MRSLPAGTVTFLFTDIEGSTRLLHELGDGYAAALAEHRRVLREAFARHGGVEVDTQGDAFFVAFARASDAVAAAAEGQAALERGQIRVRMGLHTGEPIVTEEGYVGLDVHRAARIAAAGHGGQVLLSRSTRDLVAEDVSDLGEHRLKDLSAAERLFQLGEGEFPALRTLYGTNLPFQPSPLVGRDRELGEIAAFVRRGERLVTLTGAGGCGKTRLALHVAAAVADEFAAGVWFVPLASVADPSLVAAAIAAVVGEVDHLRGRELLLVLDNVEHLLPDAATTIATLPVRVIATSRERLALAAEQEYPVAPLLLQEGIALFAQRARRVSPAFEPDEHVGEIVRRVDGLPLGVELAAARVKVMTSAQILERLGGSIDVLASVTRDAPERQRTLRATIGWSYRLLDAGERRLFADVSIFTGGFELDAASAVCGASVDSLESLVDKSLLRETNGGRFFMLETIRTYAGEILAADGDVNVLRHAHAVHLLDLIVRSRAFEGERRSWRERLHSELPNLRAAIAWALGAESYIAAQLIAGARPFGVTPGELADWTEQALRKRDLPRQLEGDLLHAAAHAAMAVERVEDSETLWCSVLARRRADGDDAGETRALAGLATTARLRGDVRAARVLWKEALALARRRGASDDADVALINLAEVEASDGDPASAAARLELVLQRAQRMGNGDLAADALISLGDLALDAAALERAVHRYRDALVLIARRLSRRRSVRYCLAGLASTAAARGDAARAGRLWCGAEREIGRTMFSFERARYEQAIGAISDDPAFLRAYSESRTAPLLDLLASVD